MTCNFFPGRSVLLEKSSKSLYPEPCYHLQCQSRPVKRGGFFMDSLPGIENLPGTLMNKNTIKYAGFSMRSQ